MQLNPSGLGHLTYCTNIHAAEHWPDVLHGLNTHLPAIKSQVCPDIPLGVGLRLSASAAQSLSDPEHLSALREALSNQFYVYTLNGFPYGVFHGASVKENAYRPDWSEPSRLAYTNQLADLLAQLLPESLTGTISTVPGTFKPWANERPELVDSIVQQLLAHVAHLVTVREQTGRSIHLALEPEPYCLLETVAETVEFFQTHLFSPTAVKTLAGLCGLNDSDAERAVHEHIGVCYDVCHAAVEFEDPKTSIDALTTAGIRIGKLQLSSALRIVSLDDQTLNALRAFDEPVYLHQVVQRSDDGTISRYADLSSAFAAVDRQTGAEWRVHFHVPVFLPEMPDFSTTQAFLAEMLALHRANPISEHLEVETYTWDVLPEAHRSVNVSDAISRELNWVCDQLR